jgi:Carbohydrate family 9 binding domain-like
MEAALGLAVLLFDLAGPGESLPGTDVTCSRKKLPGKSMMFTMRAMKTPLPMLGIFAFIQEVSFAGAPNGPLLDETRTAYALRINAPVIDGAINVLDPDEWRFAAGNSDYWHVFPDTAGFAADGLRGGSLVLGTLPADSDDLSVKIFAGFDTDYLYVAVQVRDSVIQNDSALADSANGITWEDDSVEVFVDGANANDANWAAGQIGGQFVITANNAYREVEAGNPGYGPNAAWDARTALLADGSGYEAEFRISLATLGHPGPGDVIGFTVAVNDDDDGGVRERQVIWVGSTHQPLTYGNLVLGAQSYTAVKVTTPPNPDGTINPGEYGDAAEIRVNAMTGVVYIPGADDDLPVADLEYKAWIVHDNDAVYIAFDVTDETVRTTNSDVEQLPDMQTWEDDSVEVFFDLDNSRSFDGGTVLGNGVFEGQYTQTHKGFYYDGSPSKDAMKGVHWFGSGSLTPTGYQVEFKILKSTLGNPQDNTPIGFHLAVNDDDVVLDYSHIGWTGQAHHEYTYGTLTLDGPSSSPSLDVARSGNNLVISWPAAAAGFHLESSTSLLPASWSPVTTPPVVVGNQATVTVGVSDSRRFYRLSQ